MKIALTIPGTGGTPIKIDSDLPQGVPTGGLIKGNEIIGVLIEIILIGAILFALFTIFRSGISMITSGGQKEKFQMERERIRYAIIGLVVVFMSFFLVNLFGSVFGITFPLFNFQ